MDVVNFLQSFLPQYVLGVLPAMAILGSSPEDSCMSKFLYFFYSLGSPFRGLFYYINVNNNKLEMSSYWLEPENFDLNGKNPAYKPFGIHAKKIKQINITPEQQEITDDCAECVAKTSILDKVTSFVSICYIILGVISALGRITGSCVKEDWPYIPLALVWTLPAVIKRIWGGMLVVHDPAKNFLNNTTNGQDNHRLIPLENYNRTQRHNRYIRVALTALISIIVPWFSVALAYFTPPKGYFCRSQYLTILCSIWTFNSLITLIFHIKGENNHKIRLCLNIINALSGLFVLVLLIILVLLSLSTSLWIKFGGEHCSIDSACLEG